MKPSPTNEDTSAATAGVQQAPGTLSSTKGRGNYSKVVSGGNSALLRRQPPPTNGAVGFLRVTHQNFPTQVGHGHYLRAGIDFKTPVNSAYQAKPKAKKTHGVAKTRASAGRWMPAGDRHAG